MADGCRCRTLSWGLREGYRSIAEPQASFFEVDDESLICLLEVGSQKTVLGDVLGNQCLVRKFGSCHANLNWGSASELQRFSISHYYWAALLLQIVIFSYKIP